MTTLAERIATVESQITTHEIHCNERMNEVRNTVKALKDDREADRRLTLSTLITSLLSAIGIIATILLKQHGG